MSYRRAKAALLGVTTTFSVVSITAFAAAGIDMSFGTRIRIDIQFAVTLVAAQLVLLAFAF